jgi:hypothetical protein
MIENNKKGVLKMKKNMGLIDRVLRVVLAVLVAILIITGVLKGGWAIVLGILAGVFLITSFIGFCPLYTPFKISTKKKS